MPPSSVKILEHRYHLDQPFFTRYFEYVKGLLHGDLGYSIIHREDVSALVAARIGTTLELVLYAAILIIIIGVGLGLLGGLRAGATEQPQSDADDDDQDGGVQDQLERGADARGNQGRDVLAMDDRVAQIPVQQALHVLEVAREERLVEVVAVLEDLDDEGGNVRPPDNAAIGLPGATYSALKITKLETSSATINIKNRRSRNRAMLSRSPPRWSRTTGRTCTRR